MNHKSELAILRNQQLAKLREQTGSPERFTLDFACAAHDRAFRVTFARLSTAERFRCESVDKSDPGKATALKRLHGLFRQAESKQFRADEVNLGSVACAWCAGPRRWTLCSQCKAFVCGARSTGEWFTCRDSCGARFMTGPLETLEAAPQSGSTSNQRAIGRTGQSLLTGRKAGK
jgi:hypothetical protein